MEGARAGVAPPFLLESPYDPTAKAEGQILRKFAGGDGGEPVGVQGT